MTALCCIGFAIVYLTLLLPSAANTSMCKILYRSYYNFKSVDFNDFPSIELTSNHKVFYRLCTNYNHSLANICGDDHTSFGNIVLINNSSTENPRCESISAIEKSSDKTEWNVTFRHWLDEYYGYEKDQVDTEDRLLNNTSGTAIVYTYQTNNQFLNAQQIKKISFGLVCNFSKSPSEAIFKRSHINDTLWIFHEGIQACGFKMIEPSVFMRNHIIYPILFILMSVTGMVVRRWSERYMMSLFGMQFGMFITVIFLANLELNFHFTPSTTFALVFCSFLVGCFFGFICFASRNISIFVLFLGAAVSISYTLLSVLVMTTGKGLSVTVFVFTIVCLIIIMSVLSNVPSFYDKYAHLYLVSLDFPFYLTLSISVIIGWYPDLLTIKRAQELSIKLVPRKENWYLIALQLVLTTLLIIDSHIIARNLEAEEGKNEEKRKSLLNESDSNDRSM